MANSDPGIAGQIAGNNEWSDRMEGLFAIENLVTGSLSSKFVDYTKTVAEFVANSIGKYGSQAFVGGFMDGRTNVFQSVFQEIRALNPMADLAYFSWTDIPGLADFVNARQGNVSVLAHSWGADTAARLAYSGTYMAELITFDGVSRHADVSTHDFFSGVAANTGSWTNVNAVGGGIFDGGNWVAQIGGAWGSSPRGYADFYVEVDRNHSSVVGCAYGGCW
ncbi:hypothetical protein [Microvirga zambiensis]|uniref:hypothetical protein n=1 Tax=Microvirga zambiensis TaxID=1402137 RepID=UPI00192033BB|nr:hypothetical protein [Microvirga zambiensis]